MGSEGYDAPAGAARNMGQTTARLAGHARDRRRRDIWTVCAAHLVSAKADPAAPLPLTSRAHLLVRDCAWTQDGHEQQIRGLAPQLPFAALAALIRVDPDALGDAAQGADRG